MSALVVLVTSAALGIEVGWEPLAGGGHEYTIQIEPQLLDVLKRGKEEIFSEVPPEIDVRRYRIRVGTGTLPRDAGDPPAAKPHRDPQPPPAKADPVDVAPVETAPPPDRSESPPPQPTEPAPTPAETPPSFPTTGDPFDDNAQVVPGAPRETRDAPPAKLPPDSEASGPIQTTFDAHPSNDAADPAAREAQKPSLPKDVGKPWSVLVASVALLCCSLGANLYLGWIAWDARTRYRNAVAKLHTAA